MLGKNHLMKVLQIIQGHQLLDYVKDEVIKVKFKQLYVALNFVNSPLIRI